ncbi:MAG: GNAT family N-acetyltransferase [Polaromonas sp.]
MVKAVDLGGEPADEWDRGIESSVNGTLFHLRQFLGYHGDRFAQTARFYGFEGRGKILARIAFAVVEQEGRRVFVSPYGGSYGGIVFAQHPSLRDAIGITDSLINLFDLLGVEEAFLANPIAASYQGSLDTASFALTFRGFSIAIRDVTSVFVRGLSVPSERARRSAKKAMKLGVKIDWSPPIEDYWKVMMATYRKHGVTPTHTFENILSLRTLLGERIRFPVAYFEGEPAAAIGCFRVSRILDSAFYICQDPELQHSQALSLLISEQLEKLDEEVKCFSFGTSTYDMQPRHNIFEFKENFTKIGMFRETYSWRKPQ